MLPNERRQQIREFIQQHGSVRISDLSEQFQVSEMTIHRDLKPLIEEGVVTKTYGGVEWRASVDAVSSGCILCGRAGEQRLAYRLVLANHRVETACCPHCGLLRHHQVQEQVAQALCQDFFTNTTISANTAWYVLDSHVSVGCCQPQVLSFQHKETAERFVKGFGGKLFPLVEAMDFLQQQMKQDACSGCHSNTKEEL
jgi:DeoR family transcriptional regulator, copper-sensing transcriptional repressor